MKICLLEHPREIQSGFCNDIANTPLSSSLITPSLWGNLGRGGHEVEVIEGFMGRLSYAEIATKILASPPQILGVHLIYQWEESEELKAFLGLIKKETATKIIFYGFYATFAYRELFAAYPQVDCILLGEAERGFCAVANGLRIEGIPGAAWKKPNGEIGRNPRDILKELDFLARPKRSPELLAMREINLEGSRGCYNNCTFCYINNYYGKPCLWRGHSVDYICGEIESLVKDYGKERFYFVDPNFFGPGQQGKKRGRGLAKALKPYHIKFGMEARVNDIEEGIMVELVDAGLEEILIGMESGSQNCLDRLNKHTTVAQNEEALRILKRVGISPNIGFIMFEPTSSLADIRGNFMFLQRNDLLKNLEITSNLLYHNQIVLQGADCYGELKNLPTPAPYHVELPYDNRQVGVLASVMRHITNVLFREMAALWKNGIQETAATAHSYRELNDLYVDAFDTLLTELEGGKIYQSWEIEEMTAEYSKRIIALTFKIKEAQRPSRKIKT